MMMMAAIVLLAGCKTKERIVTVERVRTDTTYITRHHRDSVWLHDSIYMKEWLAGDTVYQLRDRWHTQYVERVRLDTTYVSKTDSIPVPYPVEKIVKVDKPLTWWQRLRMMIGGIVLVGLAVIATLKLVSNKFL
jgi:hypothetical protein